MNEIYTAFIIPYDFHINSRKFYLCLCMHIILHTYILSRGCDGIKALYS